MISEKQVLDKLKKKYNEKGKQDCVFYARTVGNWFEPKVNAYAVRTPLRHLEEKGIVEQTGFGSSRITWRTCFGKNRRVE
jgi:hypothetical protein